MKTVRVEFQVPDSLDPSDLLVTMSEKALDIWEDHFNEPPSPHLRDLICNQLLIQELQETCSHDRYYAYGLVEAKQCANCKEIHL